MQIFLKVFIAIIASITSIEIIKESMPVGVFVIFCFVILYGLFYEEKEDIRKKLKGERK